MKKNTFFRITITALCGVLLLCVLFGEFGKFNYIDDVNAFISGINKPFIFSESTQFKVYIYLLLIISPIVAAFVWIKKKIFVYIAAILIGIIGLCDLLWTINWIVKMNRNIGLIFEISYDTIIVFLPLLISILCLYLARKVSHHLS